VPHDFQPATAPQPAQDRDFEGEEFAQAQSYRLDRLRLAAREEQIAADLDLTDDLHPGLSAELVSELERLVRAHPLRERLRGLLMLALYRSGRRAEALSAYHEARRTFVEELGIDPGPELQQVYGSILRKE
jgi:DNA-binding SARP family transcriptional activator